MEILPSDFFVIYRCDRQSKGGGVLVAVSDSIPSSLSLSMCSPCSEYIIVLPFTSPPVYMCCIYTPLIQEINSCLDSIPLNSYIVLLGDFNLPNIDWSIRTPSSPEGSLLCDTTDNLNLVQLIQEPKEISLTYFLIIFFSSNHPEKVCITVDQDTCSNLYFFSLDIVFCPVQHKPSCSFKLLHNYSKADFISSSDHLLSTICRHTIYSQFTTVVSFIQSKVVVACDLCIMKVAKVV